MNRNAVNNKSQQTRLGCYQEPIHTRVAVMRAVCLVIVKAIVVVLLSTASAALPLVPGSSSDLLSWPVNHRFRLCCVLRRRTGDVVDGRGQTGANVVYRVIVVQAILVHVAVICLCCFGKHFIIIIIIVVVLCVQKRVVLVFELLMLETVFIAAHVVWWN